MTIKPMLAGQFDAARAEFPCHVQPKLDGVRCLFDGETAWTRNGNPFIGEIQALLSRIVLTNVAGKIVLDGELYIEGKGFQQVVSAVKRAQPLTEQLQYYVFDAIFPEDLSFARRWERLQGLAESNIDGPLSLVSTLACRDLVTIEEQHGTFVAAGFEGLIYRRSRSLYHEGRSANSLLKYKKFIDAEFTILGCEEAQGKNAGTPVFICECANGEQFRVNMKGSHEQRAQMWWDRECLVGKPLTVRFQELTDRGVPRFPIGVSIRTYEQ